MAKNKTSQPATTEPMSAEELDAVVGGGGGVPGISSGVPGISTSATSSPSPKNNPPERPEHDDPSTPFIHLSPGLFGPTRMPLK